MRVSLLGTFIFFVLYSQFYCSILVSLAQFLKPEGFFYQLRIMKYVLRIVLTISLVLNLSCKEKENVTPTCEIITPLDGDTIMQGDLVNISVAAHDTDGTIVWVELYIDGDEIGRAEESTYEYEWITDEAEVGVHIISAVTADDEGQGIADNIGVLLDVAGGFNPDLTYGKVTDYDGNNYATIEIGEQTWMAENLKVTHYADGSSLPQVADGSEWEGLASSVKAYSWSDTLAGNGDRYGGLYTWAAAVNGASGSDEDPGGIQGVCPDGWHMPGDAEWKKLEIFLGMSQDQSDKQDWRGTNEGGQIKERGFSHWEAPNLGGDNSSGFTAISGGFRSSKGGFYSLGIEATFWTTDEEVETDKAWYRILNFQKENVYRHYNDKSQGLSVRCVKNAI